MSILINTAVTGVVLATALTGATIGMTQAQADQGVEASHVHNMTSDLQACQTDMMVDVGFTRGHFSQDAATSTVAACEVTQGTVLTVKVSADGRNFTLIASSAAAPNFNVVADTAAGGGAQVVVKAA